ncbi:WXG100 family type VII secretion target [Micromonospora sp. NPDC049559]|uniref:WXG100 family type VII secretion target n=1 Tax=Micromonospora sp. NPDC049559 TaxID=3155923 RepID=UPI003449C2B2
MAGNLKQIDEPTTVALIQAFKQASDDQQSAHNAVSTTQAALLGGWTGVASGRFNDGLGEWMQGLLKVQRALNMIDESMVAFSKLTANTEDDAIALAAQGQVSASWT